MFRLLSYPLSASAPVWPGNPPAARCEPFESIAGGDMANTTVLHLFSHSGTHLDAPKHFNDEGPAAAELPLESYVFSAPVVLDVAKPDGGPILREELEAQAEQLQGADLAFLNTGWSRMRAEDPERYINQGPLVDPAAARYLMEEVPGLRALAIDAPSVGSPAAMEPTIETHQILTGAGRSDGRYLLIFEDLRIDPDLGEAQRIYAWPLFIEGSDGSPLTIVAEFGEDHAPDDNDKES